MNHQDVFSPVESRKQFKIIFRGEGVIHIWRPLWGVGGGGVCVGMGGGGGEGG